MQVGPGEAGLSVLSSLASGLQPGVISSLQPEQHRSSQGRTRETANTLEHALVTDSVDHSMDASMESDLEDSISIEDSDEDVMNEEIN